ncbi:Ulp1 protease family, C-terminal catalytic domain [Sesbania bispinosa]|nr:Ulp1 protease family, C-terminal catalytic domain [Sesbania bispinosa]
MSLSDTEAELAVYIFMNSHVLDGKEILVFSLAGLAIGDRQTLRTIMPTKNVSTQFIHMVIFIPVNDNDMHWYLVVFDLEEQNVWLLDSNPFPDRNRLRRLHVKKLVNAESRMRLALDLVLDRHNQMRNETVRKAHQKFKVFTEDWDNCDDI